MYNTNLLTHTRQHAIIIDMDIFIVNVIPRLWYLDWWKLLLKLHGVYQLAYNSYRIKWVASLCQLVMVKIKAANLLKNRCEMYLQSVKGKYQFINK